MGKAYGVIGGFFIGVIILIIAVSIIMGILRSYTWVELEDGADPESATYGGPSFTTIILLFLGYLCGWAVSIYFGHGFSYDTGYSDCKTEEFY